QRFPDLQALGSALHLGAQAPCCPLTEAIAVVFPARPGDAAEVHEALGGVVLEVPQMSVENVLAPAAIEVDDGGDARNVERLEQPFRRLLQAVTPERRA